MATSLKKRLCVRFSFIIRALTFRLLGCVTAPAETSLGSFQNSQASAYCPSVCACVGPKWDSGKRRIYLWFMNPFQIYPGVKSQGISYYRVSALHTKSLTALFPDLLFADITVNPIPRNIQFCLGLANVKVTSGCNPGEFMLVRWLYSYPGIHEFK